MRAVNLLPRDNTPQRRPLGKLAAVGGASTVALSLLVAAGYLNAHSSATNRLAELDQVQVELAALPVVAPAQTGDAELAQVRRDRITAIAGALAGRVEWDRLLRQLASVAPADVWLTGMSASGVSAAALNAASTATAAGAAPTTSPKGSLTIEGYTYSHEGVARLLKRLEVVPDLADVRLESSTSTTVQAQDVVQFQIVATLRSGGAGS